ncbi:hypothetical protein F5B20DRAFT_572328 [Whalleya microplaca]|nr:hypothetical protein F5B20DRAFT_572328 [Whalleya microplaca]
MQPTDTIIPLHSYDDTLTNRSVVLECTMRFDDVLDPYKLHSSLEKLLSRPDWRKLGGRLRLNSHGRLDYHVPESYDEKRPGVAFFHSQFNTEIAKDPVGAKLPKPTAQPTVLGDPGEIAAALRAWGAPQTLDDYLDTDIPQLSLHVVSFTDATILSLSWPHTFLDALGRKAILEAWVAELEGRHDDVPPLHGVTRDPLLGLGYRPQEGYVLSNRRLSPLEVILFALLYIWNTFIWARGEETRIACISASRVKALHRGALEDIGSKIDDDGKRKPFVSEGDVISGWMTRLALQHQRNSNKTVSIMNALGMRSVLANDLLPSTHAYVGNAVAGAWAFLSTGDLYSKPLGYVASVIRRSIVEQGTREQVEARAAVDRISHMRRESTIYGDATMVPLMFSNWSKAKFFDTNFSAAVVRPGIDPSKRVNKLGRPSYIQPNGIVSKMTTRNSFIIVGKDAEGNYWVSGTLQRGVWAKVQEAMDAEQDASRP